MEAHVHLHHVKPDIAEENLHLCSLKSLCFLPQ
jgi:hypothetical protein